MRLNTKGQLTSGEWCNDKDGSGNTLTVQWCQMGTVDGPWRYISEQKQMFHSGLKKCLGLGMATNKITDNRVTIIGQQHFKQLFD